MPAFDLPSSISPSVAREILKNPDSDALSCLLSAGVFLRDELIDEDGQPLLEGEIQELLAAELVEPNEDNLAKICGLLNAVAGEEFLNLPIHFKRMVGAIVEGELYFYEDEEEPTLPEVYWALYLINLCTEDDVVEELGPKVRSYIATLAENEAEDNELVQEALERGDVEPDELEPYIERSLYLRRRKMAKSLKALGCLPEWVEGLDTDLAEILERV